MAPSFLLKKVLHAYSVVGKDSDTASFNAEQRVEIFESTEGLIISTSFGMQARTESLQPLSCVLGVQVVPSRDVQS
jgi:hypothetical protein